MTAVDRGRVLVGAVQLDVQYTQRHDVITPPFVP